MAEQKESKVMDTSTSGEPAVDRGTCAGLPAPLWTQNDAEHRTLARNNSVE